MLNAKEAANLALYRDNDLFPVHALVDREIKKIARKILEAILAFQYEVIVEFDHSLQMAYNRSVSVKTILEEKGYEVEYLINENSGKEYLKIMW